MKWAAKIANWIIGAVMVLYLFVALIFTQRQLDDQCVAGIVVEVRDRNQVDFLGEEQVIQALKNRNIRITNEPIDSINKAYVKEVVLDIPHVRGGEVYFTPDGLFHISIKQRVPVMRVVSGSIDYYVDEGGDVFPVSVRFTSKVPVFTGAVSIDMIKGGMLKLADFLNDNEFWGAMIDEVHVRNMDDIELVARVGNHRILIGSTDELEWKFEKLMSVYEKAFPVVGWDIYESVDLRFGNQVVCKRKNES